jgi:hypothetical protein
MNKIFFLFLLVFSTQRVFATATLDATTIEEYLKIQKEFFAESCRAGTLEVYQKLEKNFKGDGNFIPTQIDEKLDLKTIKNVLSLMVEKGQWIQNQVSFLKSVNERKINVAELDLIHQEYSALVDLNKEFHFSKSEDKKIIIQQKAEKHFSDLLLAIESFKKNYPYAISYKFPVNHLALRAEYDKVKYQAMKEARARANMIYLFRKVIQDGTFDEDLAHNDSFIRAGFDSLYLSLTNSPHRAFLTENERVDLQFFLSNYNRWFAQSTAVIIKRFENWKERSDRSIAFYQNLVNGKLPTLGENSQIKDATALLEERARSLYTLRDFVLTKEAQTYEYWSKKSELFQALFAIETILANEVGLLDGPHGLERRDVAQVVINRFDNLSYNQFAATDLLPKYINAQVNLKTNMWLNVLFKEGEFSFTYFYIPGNFNIYCPEMTRIGQSLRKQNLKIAMDLLNHPRSDFRGVRYFSRVSMFGRIEMDSLWSNFSPIEESPGLLVKNSKMLLSRLEKDNYKFLYEFSNLALKKSYMAVEIQGKHYVVDIKNPKQIYNYRNPHQFKYFSELK